MARSFQRPENALKRAHEFIDVDKPNRALDVLYDVIRRGKMRATYSEKLLEPIMYKFLELCVDLKKSHYAKEGLYQYRNICQSVNVSSLETVVRFYLQLADERTEAARLESHQAVVDIDDLDNLTSPEEMLLSAVSGEDAQDRSDRTILTPWVKFLWESYRQCLELLRTNSRVEKLYHDIAKHAFKFCEKYARKTEFRKLCENLRTHLSNIQKQQGLATAVNLNNPETQQMNLETRLEQLNYAIKMELWQEAYKAIEDISDLMGKSKKLPKPHVMAMYYQKLSLVFWKAGNLLFHAAALFKLFQLLRDQKKNISKEELSKRAAVVLLSVLAIPLPSAHPEFDRFIETEKSALEKIDRLAMLLSLPKPPTRASLIRDINRYNVVNTAPTELQDMYALMETEFDPLHLCNRMSSYFDWIKEKSESTLAQYIDTLKEMTTCRLIKQIGQVYQTIKFDRLLELAVFVTPFHLERVLVDLVRHNDLQIRIDHRTRSIRFGVDLSESQREDLPEGPTLQKLPSEIVRNQLVDISAAMFHTISMINPDKKRDLMEPIRAQTIQLYQQSRKNEHHRLLQRQHIIEERKEMLENQNLEREESHRRAQEEQLKRQKDEEQERLRREASKREKERHDEQIKQIQTKQIKDKLLQISKTSYGQKMIEKFDKDELMNLGAEEIMQRQVEELEKERKELQKKLKTQEKNIDFYERAKRLLEIPKLKIQLEEKKAEDKKFWETQEKARIENLEHEHKAAFALCDRLKRMLPHRQMFVDQLMNARKSEIEEKLNDFNARLDVSRKNRIAERKEQRKKDRREAYYRAKAEEEQLHRDEEIKEQREQEERLESERMQKDEEEKLQRRRDIEQEYKERTAEDAKSTPWRPRKATASQQKEEDKKNAWRVQEDEKPSRQTDAEDGGKDDWRREPAGQAKEDRPQPRDIERAPAREFTRGTTRDDDRAPSRDEFSRGPSRDFERGQTRDFERGQTRDFERGQTRDFERGQTRDFERGPSRDIRRDNRDAPSRDFERAPAREFTRGTTSTDDRAPSRSEFSRGPPRDFERGQTRDFERGPSRDIRRDNRDAPSRDFERAPAREFTRGTTSTDDRAPSRSEFSRGPPRDFERGQTRDFERGPSRDIRRDDRDTSSRDVRGSDRRPTKDFERRTTGGTGGSFERRGAAPRTEDGGSTWRRDAPRDAPREEKPREAPREEKPRKDDRQKEDADGWRKV